MALAISYSGDPVGKPLTGRERVWWGAVGMLEGRPVLLTNGILGIQLWDLHSGNPVGKPLTEYTGRVRALAMGTLGGCPILATSGSDETVRVWDLRFGGAEDSSLDLRPS